MNLLKTSFLTSLSTVIKIICGFVINKVVAVSIGPAGLAAIGQFQNFAQIATTVANGAIHHGIVKYTAEYSQNKNKMKQFLNTALSFTMLCSIVTAVIIFIFHNKLSEYFLNDTAYSSVFLVFSLTIVLFALNTFFLLVLNGLKDVKKFVSINIITSIVSLAITVTLIYNYNLIGALYALSLYQSVIFFITFYMIIKLNWFSYSLFKFRIEWRYLKKLTIFILMSLTSSITVPISYLVIRKIIINEVSLNEAGYWEGVSKISEYYLMVVTTSLYAYYFPKISELRNKYDIKREILQTFKVIIPIVLFAAFMIFSFKKYIILIAFDSTFSGMSDLFLFQVIGDIAKVAYFILRYVIIAKAMTKIYVITEIIVNFGFCFLAYYFISIFGTQGATIAYLINYLLNFGLMIYLLRDTIFSKNTIQPS